MATSASNYNPDPWSVFGIAPPTSRTYNTSFDPVAQRPGFSAAEPLQMAEQDRGQAQWYGDVLDQENRDTQAGYQDTEGGFRDWSLGGPGGYGTILSGQGGYSPDAQTNLLQENKLSDADASQEELDSLYLQPWEQQGMMGNSYAARDAVTGRFPGLEYARDIGNEDQRGSAQMMMDDLGNAIDPNNLLMSQDFANNYQFGPRDAQDMVDQAGRTVGMQNLAQQDALNRAAFSAGNTNPMALAAAQSRSQMTGNIAAGDAMTNARIQAKRLGLDTTEGRENMRLGTERDLSSRLTDAAKTGGAAAMDTERHIADANQSLGQYETGQIGNLTQTAEQAAANRYGTVAANRQATGAANQDRRYTQQMGIGNALSSRYGTIYGQQKAEEAEGRGFLTGQQDRAQAGGNAAQDRRLNIYGTRTAGIDNATKTAIAAKNIPTAIDKGLAFAGSLLGGG